MNDIDSLHSWKSSAQSAAAVTGFGGPSVAEMTRLETYAEVEEVFKSRDFVQGGAGLKQSAPLALHTLITLHGDDHFARRHIESVLFRREALVSYERDLLMPAIEQSFQARRAGATKEQIRADLLPMCRDIFLRVGAAIVGIDNLGDPASLQRLRQLVEKVAIGVDVEFSNRNHDDVLAEAFEAKAQFIEEYFVPSWSRRERLVASWEANKLDEHSLPNDLLTLVIRSPEHFRKWDQDLLVREARLFITAAAQPTARAIPHTIQEVGLWLERQPTDRERLQDLDFLRSAVAETLRLHPTPPSIRRALRSTVLQSGRRIAEDEYVALDTRAANRDPAVFGPDADQFRADRTLGRAQSYGLSFGGGPHSCIGKALAVGDPSGRVDGPTGMLVLMTRELYRAGVRPDPARPAQMRTDMNTDSYATFPVCLDTLS